jgi:hypothetical protein
VSAAPGADCASPWRHASAYMMGRREGGRAMADNEGADLESQALAAGPAPELASGQPRLWVPKTRPA